MPNVSDLQQVLSERDGDGFGAAVGSELGHDGVHVPLDAVLADAEPVGDGQVREAFGDGGEDEALAFGQFGDGRILCQELFDFRGDKLLSVG